MELLIVVTLVGVVSTIGSLYYNSLMSAAREERCRTDCRTLIKAIQKLESDTKVTIRPADPGSPDPAPNTARPAFPKPGYNYPYTGMHPLMDPLGSGVNEPNGFNLEKLLDFRVMSALPDDAYGFPYLIDVTQGIVFSMGPDGLPDSGDDIRVPLRPPFEANKANFLEDRRTIEVHFSRKLDPYSMFFTEPTTPSPITVEIPPSNPVSAPPLAITTVVRDISNPFCALVRLNQPAPLPAVPSENYILRTVEHALDRQVRSMDASPLTSQVALAITNY